MSFLFQKKSIDPLDCLRKKIETSNLNRMKKKKLKLAIEKASRLHISSSAHFTLPSCQSFRGIIELEETMRRPKLFE